MDCDCVIIGAGPAGLHCGTYLGRFLRSVIVFHGGKSRAEWIPVTHNFPGFPQGITGPDLLRLLKRQAERHGAEIRREHVSSVEGTDGAFVVRTPRTETRTRKIVLATGVQDIPPEVPNARHYKGRTIRHCPICDAHEARGRKLVVFGSGDRAARMAIWLSHYTSDLSLLINPGTKSDIPDDLLNLLEQYRIRVIEQRVVAIEERNQQLGTILLENDTRIENVFRGYSAMGLKPNSELAAAMGVELDPQGYIKVDSDQRTNLPGIYAIGDIVSGQLGQLSVAVGHAAIASIAIHNSMLAI